MAPLRPPNRAQSMTVFSLLRPPWLSWPPGGEYLQHILLRVGSRRSPTTVRRLSFIHFARLTIIRRFPGLGQQAEDVRPPLMLFESTYDGTFDQYIDAFVDAIPVKM